MIIKFDPPVIAHRGASAYAPENTIVAFTKAAQLGAKWIEFDVMLSADGVPIVFHDEELDRTTDGQGKVSHYSYDYLRSLDAGAWFDPIYSGEKIPALKHVVEFLQNTGMNANVEVKPNPGHEKETVKKTLQETLSMLPRERLLFSSFSFESLTYLREYGPNCLLGLLLHDWWPEWQEASRALDCVSINVNQEIMTKEAAQLIKGMGKQLLCYTVNEPSRALELYSWGVDAVFSDAPDRIMDALLLYLPHRS